VIRSSLKVKFTKKSKKSLQLIKEWPERVAALVRMAPNLYAHEALMEIPKKIPKLPEYNLYARSFRVSKVEGTDKSMYVVRVKPLRRPLTQNDMERTVLYVRVKKRMTRPSPEALILQSFNPWTLSTLPVYPKKTEATVISRRVTKGWVDRVARRRRKDRAEWTAALHAVGVRLKPVATAMTMPGMASTFETFQDVNMLALRLELGISGVQGAAHWRPGVRRAVKTARRRLGLITKKTLLNSKDRSWKGWSPQHSDTISMRVARSYAKFQKKLGL